MDVVYVDVPDCSDTVDYVFAIRWDVPEPTPQRLLGDAGCVLIFQPGEARLHGPTRKAKTWSVTGTSWAVTVKFQPGMTPAVGPNLIDSHVAYADAPHVDVTRLMQEATAMPAADVAAGIGPWLLPFNDHVDDNCLLVNRICRHVATDTSVNSVAEMAERFSMTTRTLHRLLTRSTGLPPFWFIERRRIQDAIRLLHEQPDHPLPALAASLGFSDHAHFGRSCRKLTGLTPSELRGGWRG